MTPGRCLFFGMFLLSVTGCGGPAPKAEAVVQASGMVKLNGRPTPGVRVVFHPTGNNKSLGGCWAMTDDQGKFKAMTLSNKEGIPAGSYHVTFSRYVTPEGTPLPANESPTMTKSSESVAPKWSNISAAGLHNKIEIPDKGTTTLDFNISSVPKKS
jgi:hypothetical protein